jgi:cell fate (sporulation/competence/biofilm development) regulator YlbF (YheA/YmcA/DUF963 family)
MPLRALEDALRAQVSEAVRENEQYQAAMEAKQTLDEEAAAHVERVELEEPRPET